MEKLNRAAKCSILGPQNLGSGGGPGPRGPPWICGCILKHKKCLWLCVLNDTTLLRNQKEAEISERDSELNDTAGA